MANIIGFTKRITGPHRMNWTKADIDELRPM